MRPSDALPDFCRPQAVLLLVLLGLLLAILLVLAEHGLAPGFWLRLGLNGIMIEAVVLASSFLLCAGRPVLLRMPPRVALAVIFLFIQVLTALCSWVALQWFLLPGATTDALAGRIWIARNVLISVIASLVFLRYLILHRHWLEQVRAEAEARLNALQARIRPHFLFNTLNTIASLVRSRPDDAEQAVLDLSDLLRTGLRNDSWHTLADELELVRGYLRIEAQRLGRRLTIDWAIPDDLPLDQNLPALLVQPLVENAIVHGIARRADGGRLRLDGQRERGRWRLRVTNPIGESEAEPGHRMALSNIRQRIELAYEDQARLRTRVVDGEFIAELTLPDPPRRGGDGVI
ncbi:MAG: sensor histidine kinase [Wenzhouxiangellaceae bacterium]